MASFVSGYPEVLLFYTFGIPKGIESRRECSLARCICGVSFEESSKIAYFI